MRSTLWKKFFLYDMIYEATILYNMRRELTFAAFTIISNKYSLYSLSCCR